MLRRGDLRSYNSLAHAFIDMKFSACHYRCHFRLRHTAPSRVKLRPSAKSVDYWNTKKAWTIEVSGLIIGKMATNRQQLVLVTCTEVVKWRSACQMRFS